MTEAVDQFKAALQPIAGIDADHQTGLVIKRGVFSSATAFKREIARHRQKEEVAVVSDVVIKGFPPEVRLGLGGDDDEIIGLFHGGRLVEPLHFCEKRFAGKLILQLQRYDGRSESL